MFKSPEHAKAYLLAGQAIITIKSEASGAHYTYQVYAKPHCHFVWVLTSSEDYTYVGMIDSEGTFKLTRASTYTEQSTVYRAFRYLWDRLRRNEFATDLQVYHEGTCGRCGKPLTNPESIERGLGPTCSEIT